MKIRLGVVVLAVALGAVAAEWTIRAKWKPAADEVVVQAGRAAAAGDLESAAEGLRQAIYRHPENGGYHAELGNIYLQQGRFEYAAAELESAVALVPNRPHVFCLLAQALVEERRRPEALQALDVALRKAPNCPHALTVRGEQALRDDALARALADFQQTIRIEPTFTLAYQKAGYILLETNQFRQAEELLRTGLRYSPRDSGLHVLLGECYLRESRDSQALRQAEQELRAGLAGNPEPQRVHAALGQVLIRLGRWSDARSELEQALGPTGGSQEVLYALSQVSEREGHREESARYLERYRLGQARRQQFGALKTQAAARPDDVDLQLRIARLCLQVGMLKEAARTLNDAVRIAPERREVRALRAQLFARTGAEVRAARETVVASRLPVAPR